MIHDMMPGTKEQLDKELTSAYVGIDPTADSLHIGHLVSVMMLKHFQIAGHKPIALVGGATGMIGDPSGKSQERNLLDEPTLRHNQECIKKQLAKFRIGCSERCRNGEQLRLDERFQFPEFYPRHRQTHYGKLYDVERLGKKAFGFG
jgi:tyrosyl-tRNA synthetase